MYSSSSPAGGLGEPSAVGEMEPAAIAANVRNCRYNSLDKPRFSISTVAALKVASTPRSTTPRLAGYGVTRMERRVGGGGRPPAVANAVNQCVRNRCQRAAQTSADVVADDRKSLHADKLVNRAQVKETYDADAVHAHLINPVPF